MFGTIIYVALLLINAIAILSEERFLARSTCLFFLHQLQNIKHWIICIVGWSSTQPSNTNTAFHPSYDQPGYGVAQPDIGVKARMINLIGAVRTLMRSA